MLAGGIGYANIDHAIKKKPKKGDLIVVLGGDNYRIGMGGASVSSSNTGEFNSIIELNAVQRSNPEMQKRVANTIRAFAESDKNSKEKIEKSVRNIPNVKVTDVNHFSAYDIIKFKKVVFTESSVKELEKRYS